MHVFVVRRKEGRKEVRKKGLFQVWTLDDDVDWMRCKTRTIATRSMLRKELHFTGVQQHYSPLAMSVCCNCCRDLFAAMGEFIIVCMITAAVASN